MLTNYVDSDESYFNKYKIQKTQWLLAVLSNLEIIFGIVLTHVMSDKYNKPRTSKLQFVHWSNLISMISSLRLKMRLNVVCYSSLAPLAPILQEQSNTKYHYSLFVSLYHMEAIVFQFEDNLPFIFLALFHHELSSKLTNWIYLRLHAALLL